MSGCRDARRWMARAFDGRLELDQQFLLEEHVEGCADCAAEHAVQIAVLDALARRPEPPAERLDLERSLAAIHGQLDALPAAQRRPWALVLGLAAGLVIALGSVLLWPPADPPAAPADEVAGALVGPSSVVVHPLRPVEATDLDLDLHADVHERVRTELAGAAQLHLDQDVAAFVAAFERGTAGLLADDWPVPRLVAGLIRDPHPLLARAACRYTGLRGTRLGVARLEEALALPCKRAALAALVDAGGRGEAGLGRALWDADLTGSVAAAVRALEDDARVAWARAALEHAPPDFGARLAGAGAWIDLLAGAGGAGARELFARLEDPRLPRGELLEGLARTGLGADLLIARLEQRVLPRQVPALLDAVERLRPDGALAFLRDQAWSGEDRARAAQVLARYPGARPLVALLELDEGRRLAPEALAEAWRTALAEHPQRALIVALEHVERADRSGCRRLLEGLALSGRAAAVPALVELAAHGPLADDDRERALLLVAELGGPAHAPLLREAFRTFSPRDRDRAAACLLALHRLGGAGEVQRALEAATERTRERVLALLAGEARAATLRLRLARELEPVLASHEALTWKNPR